MRFKPNHSPGMGRDQLSAGSSPFADVSPIPTVLAEQWQGQADGANVPVCKSPGHLFPGGTQLPRAETLSLGKMLFPVGRD